jgi:Uma2 family endonuclease
VPWFDDGIVVGDMTVDDYLSGPEDMRRRELIWGVVREPPSPFFPHQRATARMTVLLDTHVREHDLGIVVASPMDVVLDERKKLVVQPDVMFISHARAGIIRDFIWGAPDLVVEVASRGTARYDSGRKLRWYREYDVLECWLVDPERQTVAVVNLQAEGESACQRFTGDARVQSAVLSRFDQAAADFFI